jgi:signal transduction histidine kinase
VRELSADLRHNLFLAAKEALTNIIKHARASEAWFRVNVTVSALELAIEDDGQGFGPASAAAGGDGLRNMRQRLAGIGGECRVESRPGAGTRVMLRLPWRQN